MRVAAWRSAYYALADAMISSNVGDLDRFHQMMVEPSREAAGAIFIAPVSEASSADERMSRTMSKPTLMREHVRTCHRCMTIVWTRFLAGDNER
jgi:hypothetical protein